MAGLGPVKSSCRLPARDGTTLKGSGLPCCLRTASPGAGATRLSLRGLDKTRQDDVSPVRRAVDEIALEHLVKHAGRETPIEARMPTSAARLSPNGSGTREPEPISRRPPADQQERAPAEAYFQPSFDSDDSIDAQMRDCRRIAYIVTELLESREAARRRGPPQTCHDLHPAEDEWRLEQDIEIRNGTLMVIHWT